MLRKNGCPEDFISEDLWLPAYLLVMLGFEIKQEFFNNAKMATELLFVTNKSDIFYKEMTMNVRSGIKESEKHKMTVPALQSAIKILSRSDKFRMVQFILYELAEEESSSLLENGKEYPIWSPYNAHEAAEILLKELDRNRGYEK